jgi:hypothetical protein
MTTFRGHATGARFAGEKISLACVHSALHGSATCSHACPRARPVALLGGSAIS